jgi:hypothetical protein
VIGFTGCTHGAGMPWSPVTEMLRLKQEFVRSLHGLMNRYKRLAKYINEPTLSLLQNGVHYASLLMAKEVQILF